MSSVVVLLVLLYETTTLYGRLLEAVAAQHRERETRLTTGEAIAAMIAHEIRQPLAAMKLCASAALRWLHRPSPDLEEASAAMKQILADGDRAEQVVASARTLFRRDVSGRTPLNLNNQITEVLGLLQADLQRHRISVHVEGGAQPLVAFADPIQLRQLLMNLITNAIHAMSDSPGRRVLSVNAKMIGDAVLVSVADTGKGLKPEDIERVFAAPFTTKPGGMGLGLLICRLIAEAHGGRLWATGREQGGALFQFTIPSKDVVPDLGP